MLGWASDSNEWTPSKIESFKLKAFSRAKLLKNEIKKRK